MNVLAALMGFGAYFLILLSIGLIGFWQAERLESWARRRFVRRAKIEANP